MNDKEILEILTSSKADEKKPLKTGTIAHGSNLGPLSQALKQRS